MKRFIFGFGLWTSILSLVALGSLKLTGIDGSLAQLIKDYAFDLVVINTAILTALQGYPSADFSKLPDQLRKTAAAVALFAVMAAVALLSVPVSAFSADLPVKTPPLASGIDSLFKGYPFGTSGFIVGIYTEGGGGSVNATVPGVGPASLTTTTAGIGGTIGYSWGHKNSPFAYSVEADFGWTNFNGSAQGLSLSGPVAFEQRFVVFMPLASIMSLLPNLPNLGTVAPFNPLPAGVTASNLQMGLMAGLDERDIGNAFAGIGQFREWRVSPMLGVVAMEQLSNGTALRSYLKTLFPDKSVCAGPVPGACANLGQEVRAGVSVLF